MTSQRELESLLVEFFDEGPVQVADRVIDDALSMIDSNSVARPLAAPRRFPSMNILSRLATAAVFGLLVVGALFYFSRPALPPFGATTTPGVTDGSNHPAIVPPSPTTPTVVVTAGPTASPSATSLSPDTAVIAYVRATDKPKDLVGTSSFLCRFSEGPTCPVNRLWLVGIDGTGAHELFPDGTNSQSLLGWSPDGRSLLYTDDGMPYMTDASGSEPQVLDTGCTEPCWGHESPMFSNDGTALVFVRGVAGTDESSSSIAILDLASGQIVELNSTAPKGGALPNWSPDRRHIVFTRFGSKEVNGPFEPTMSAAFVVDADGQNLRQISPATLDAEYARWSPDGSRILFTSPTEGGADIYTMATDGSDVRRLTTDGVSIGASWTPDGRILFIRKDSAADDVPVAFWTMDGDGGNAAELIPATVTGAVHADPLWQPTGGSAVVPPPWNPSTPTSVGPPAPTPLPTPIPELAPGFSWTGSMAPPEGDYGVETAALLQDGRVLVIRACDPVAQLYDPQNRTFSPTGSLTVARSFGTATLLQDGRVLIAGGSDCSETSGVLGSAEVYDPGTGLFTATGSMGITRQAHAAALLSDGRVLVAGGITGDVAGTTDGITVGSVSIRLAATGANVVKSAELYDPSTGTFSPTGSMIDSRHQFTATPLLDGRVLVLGGGGEAYSARRSAEVYDPSSGTFARTGSMAKPRWLYTATLLADGRVLIAGGRSPNDQTLAAAEVYNPGHGTFSTVGPMADSRQQHTATLLEDGRVLIAGGYTQDASNWNVLSATEIYDPGTGQFSSTGSMGEARWSAVSALLNDGGVLIAGGTGIGIEDLVQLDSAVLYQP
jgi:Tol biopolymer transport system component